VLQRLAKDQVERPVYAHYPADGAEYFARLRHATPFHDTTDLREEPVTGEGVVAATAEWTLSARALEHRLTAYGYRLVEPDGRRILPDRLAALGVHGPAIGDLQRDGALDVGGRRVTLDEVSAPRRGQKFAFVMDTRLCDAVYALADGVDLLVIESTYLDEDAELAATYMHMTAAQAARVAAACGVRRLVLTHFSARYPDPAAFHAEAARHFDGDIVVAADLDRVPVPPRH
jgi:ribonuclease Z